MSFCIKESRNQGSNRRQGIRLRQAVSSEAALSEQPQERLLRCVVQSVILLIAESHSEFLDRWNRWAELGEENGRIVNREHNQADPAAA